MEWKLIDLDISKSKKFKFKVSVSGVNVQDLKGALRIIIDNIEYGFLIKIENGSVVSEIESLLSICKKDIKDGSIFDAKLELIAENVYFIPWKDKVRISNPVVIEADLEDIELKKPEVKISTIEENVIIKDIECSFSRIFDE